MTVLADPRIGKSEPADTPSPADRIAAAHQAFRDRPTPAHLTFLDRQYLRGDQNSTALNSLVSYLEALSKYGQLNPGTVAEAVEFAIAAGIAATDALPVPFAAAVSS